MTTNSSGAGRYSYVYYQITDYDIGQTDSIILADSNWNLLCKIDATATDTRTLTDVGPDQCTKEAEYVGGRRESQVALNIKNKRLTTDLSLADLQAWHAMQDTEQIISLLMLTGAREDDPVSGRVGNYLHESDTETHPDTAITNALSFRPAAQSQYSDATTGAKWRRIYAGT